jgi:hypothetical protein
MFLVVQLQVIKPYLQIVGIEIRWEDLGFEQRIHTYLSRYMFHISMKSRWRRVIPVSFCPTSR